VFECVVCCMTKRDFCQRKKVTMDIVPLITRLDTLNYLLHNEFVGMTKDSYSI
jgi:hypothetical protein